MPTLNRASDTLSLIAGTEDLSISNSLYTVPLLFSEPGTVALADADADDSDDDADGPKEVEEKAKPRPLPLPLPRCLGVTG